MALKLSQETETEVNPTKVERFNNGPVLMKHDERLRFTLKHKKSPAQAFVGMEPGVMTEKRGGLGRL